MTTATTTTPKTPTRIYLVAGPKGDRLVRAPSGARAISHCVSTDYSAEVASQDALVAAVAGGTKVETAGEEPAPTE